MNTKYLKKCISKLNLCKWKLIQTNINSLILFKSKYKYTDCIYVDVNVDGASIRHEKVYDNKFFNCPFERLLISKIYLDEEHDLIKYIKDIVEK